MNESPSDYECSVHGPIRLDSPCVRPGYKQTEVGVIPEDWDAVPMHKIASEIGDGLHGTPVYSSNGAYYFVNGNNLRNGRLVITDDTRTVDYSEYKKNRKNLNNQSILMSINGTIGNLAFFEGEAVVLGKSAAYLNVQSEVDKRFVYFSLQAENVKRQFFDGLTGSTIGNLGLTTIRNAKVPFPPIQDEQRSIATALSDVDALLTKLDQLIAKKRNLKQAAMQQLLTGQTRLPGFEGEWEVKRLGDVAEIISGGTPKTNEPSYWNGALNWCTPSDITGCKGKYITSTERTISALGLNNSGARLLPPGALLLCSRATIGEIKIAATEICTNQGFKSLICNHGVDNDFLYHKILTMKQQMVERSFGSTFLEISKSNLSSLEVLIPSYSEQTAIATVLSDMDAEITTIETRRDKTRALKQGMMQELLTGRIRLI
ncbi:MAG: restriction endonuclease subunit S [Magnetococcales bacterium]|nr:restriction endonuclease subunit S [Magnetococcales bacterium]